MDEVVPERDGPKRVRPHWLACALLAVMTLWAGSLRKGCEPTSFAMLLLKTCWSTSRSISDSTKPGEPAWAPKRFPTCSCIRSEYGSRVASELDRGKSGAEVTNLPVQTGSGSRRRGLGVSEAHPSDRNQKAPVGAPGLQAFRTQRVDAARAFLKLSADNHPERQRDASVPRGTFSWNTWNILWNNQDHSEMDSIALKPWGERWCVAL